MYLNYKTMNLTPNNLQNYYAELHHKITLILWIRIKFNKNINILIKQVNYTYLCIT